MTSRLYRTQDVNFFREKTFPSAPTLAISSALPKLPPGGNGHEKLEDFEKAVLSLRGTVEQAGGRSSIGEAIRLIRKEKKISQEDLAKKAQVARSTIVRIECGIFKSISVETLGVIAKAFGLDLKTLLLKTESLGESLTCRGHVGQAVFVLDYPDQGFRILSLIPRKKEFFFGKIQIQPERTIPSLTLPHPDQVCLNVIEGEILLTREGKSFRLKAGDYLAFPGAGEYELQNTQLVKPTCAFLVTCPSFVAC